MKLIYITGAPRCGKTTLAKKMATELNCSIFSLDAFSKSIRNTFCDFKLYGDDISIRPVINNDIFLKLVADYTNNYSIDYENHTLIVEGCHFTPEEFKSKFANAEIIALGRTGATDEIIDAIKQKDWMHNLPDEIILQYAKLIKEYSIKLKSEAHFYEYIEV
ncbi:MAG: hypothetical protein IJL63_03930 [Clostridia bacterium]|nr:hypothetical protein [Clostridia bacterium]